MKNAGYVLFVIFISCNANTKKEKLKTNDTLVNENKPTHVPFVYQPDSLERAYMDGKYFFKEYIRLKPDLNTFIRIDSDYVANYVTNLETKKLFFNTAVLTPGNRESYYKTMIAGLRESDLRIHRIVWKIKEVQEQAEGSDGGMFTVVTWLYRPDKECLNYLIDVKRDYYWRLGACSPVLRLEVGPIGKVYIIDALSQDILPLK